MDSENDPVLGTTENGITIRYHNKDFTGTWDYDAFVKNYVGSTNSSTYGSSTTTSLSGYFYVTLGGYNWVIIGRNSNLSWANMTYTNTYAQSNEQISNFIKFASYSTYANALKSQIETTTDAGIALNSANSKGLINTVSSISRSYSINLASYSSPVATTEIPSGCVLCFCEGNVGRSGFGARYYPDSDIDNLLYELYSNIKAEANERIQLTPLTTWGWNDASTKYISYSHSEYLFLLARNDSTKYSENFAVTTYLTSNEMRNIGVYWWMRTIYQSSSSGTKYRAHCVSDSGYENMIDGVSSKYYLRPAFVLKL